MNNDITCVYTLNLSESSFEEFKILVSDIVKATKKEPGTLSYVYSASEDGTRVHIIERYKYDAIISHVDITFAPFAEKFLSLATITSLTVYGSPDSDTRAKLDPFGAVYMQPFDGFYR